MIIIAEKVRGMVLMRDKERVRIIVRKYMFMRIERRMMHLL